MLKEPILKLSKSARMKNFVSHNRIGRSAARRFVAGETLEDALKAARDMNKLGIHVSLDYLGENVFSEAESVASTEQYLNLLGMIAREKLDANISVKLTALGLDVDRRLCLNNITAVLTRARDLGGIFVRIDMESSEYTERTIDIFKELWQSGFRNTGTVLQSYMYRTEDDVHTMIELKARVRLCKGAYLEPPTVAYAEKSDTDSNYVKCMQQLLDNGNYPGFATHDEKIINQILDYVKAQNIPAEKFEFQMLYGIRRDLQKKLAGLGYNVRAYVPYGSQWYPYLMRRMAERPANLFFMLNNAWRG
ncbi:MAG: proline dehydrogenase family protein [Chloroflexi bacterium]|uniref:proline dehydrogenase n=1 Tax=Candidatus Chlorohelix allophototropha TaxID=3003348 RepID=A0A8T7LXN9_9CHLR|nr:proline dehydrogenase family protein [Chloroflexota bacterium]